jgi:hypothetical protein
MEQTMQVREFVGRLWDGSQGVAEMNVCLRGRYVKATVTADGTVSLQPPIADRALRYQIAFAVRHVIFADADTQDRWARPNATEAISLLGSAP